jgi:hypothetical protein
LRHVVGVPDLLVSSAEAVFNWSTVSIVLPTELPRNAPSIVPAMVAAVRPLPPPT